MAERPVTHEGADRVSSRAEMMDVIEANRAAQINAELEESGSTVRVEHEPTPVIVKASGKDATDEEVIVDDDDNLDADNTNVDQTIDRDGKKTVAADGKKVDEQETIYDFLGEDKLPTTKVKTKVDGVETELSVADLVRDHQKTKAADKRLEEAALTKKTAEQVLADARIEAERITAAAKDAAEKGTKTGAEDDAGDDKTGKLSGKDAITSAMTLIYDGNQEGAAGILDAEINRRVAEARGSGATVDPAELAAKIKTDLSWDAALSAFNTNHAEIASDPDLAAMFQSRLNAAGPAASTPQEAIEKALEAMPSWLSKVSGKSREKDGGDAGLRLDDGALKKRNEEKAAKDAVRSNSSIRSQAKDGAEEVYDPSKVVEEMKKARGQ